MRHDSRFWTTIAIAAWLWLGALPNLHAQAEVAGAADLAERVAQIVERYGRGDLSRAWQGSRALEELGPEVVPFVAGLLERDAVPLVLLSAKTLIALGEVDGVDDALRRVAANNAATIEQRAAALDLLENFPSAKTEKLLRDLLNSDEGFDPHLRITAARTLFSVSGTARSDDDGAPRQAGQDRRLARERLIPLLEVDDPRAQAAAALALGGMGYVEARVKEILSSLELEPTAEGAQARLILHNEILMTKLERLLDQGVGAGTAEQNRHIEKLALQLEERDQSIASLRQQLSQQTSYAANPVITALLQMIERLYVDPDRVDKKQLIVEAAKGMVGSLDPFSSFMDPRDTKQFYEGISGEYAGIGAQVAKDPDDDTLLILRPIYNGPAYMADILTDDKIIEVEGVTTKGLTLEEIVQYLKGEPNTPVHMKVYRRGWREPREKTVLRRLIHIDSVHATMLPDHIGYLKLTQFGDRAVEEFDLAMDKLLASGMKALILDLRNNPGGYLQAAVSIVDSLVDEDPRPIVTQRSHSPLTEPSSKHTTPGWRGDFPIVVLVNRSSASAAEIVSGALKDFGRATIVGERSFGKGSVQRLLELPNEVNELLGGESTLRLTVQYYYLPSGRSIHTRRDPNGRVLEDGGVQPDIVVTPPEVALWRLEAVAKLQDKNAFNEYLDRFYEGNQPLFARVAELGDDGLTSVYPEFDDFFGERNEFHAEPGDIRARLREVIRRRVEDARGEQFACDFPEDRQLQRAILVALEKLGQPPANPRYAPFAKAFDEVEKVKDAEF
ncbi:MAG: S41 family peptidase [Planctomycetota bacterium]